MPRKRQTPAPPPPRERFSFVIRAPASPPSELPAALPKKTKTKKRKDAPTASASSGSTYFATLEKLSKKQRAGLCSSSDSSSGASASPARHSSDGRARLPPELLRLCLAELTEAHSTLLVLARVSRDMWRLIRHNHALLVHVYRQRFHWNFSPWHALSMVRPPSRGLWRPQDAWQTEGVPRCERARFNAFVYRVLVVRFASRCSLCGVVGLDHEDYTSIWALGLLACPTCLRANLISHRALWLDYGIWIGSALPKSANVTVNALEGTTCLNCSVFDMLKHTVFMFVHADTVAARRALTGHPADLSRGLRDRVGETLFLWRPHLQRVLRLDKARAVMPLRRAAAETLKAYVRQWNVQRLLRLAPKKGPPARWLERLMGRDPRPAWPLPSGAKCYFEDFPLRFCGETVHTFRHVLGWNPTHVAPLRRALAALSWREPGVYF